jgi:dTDP-4-amino-4,6-dideoxygalactose transaminase
VQIPGTVAQPRSDVRFADLDLQHRRIGSGLKAAFDRVLQSSAYTLGTEVESFEAEFARYTQTAHCVGVASGTAALSLMLRGLGIGPGDEVVVPAHTFIASALAVHHAGATPVLCDVDDATGLIDPAAARAAVGKRTAAVLAVHLYGQTCDMAALREITAPQGLALLEDAAQAHGARYREQPAGSLGSAAAFSFYPSKNLGALGDGGAICTDDELLAARLRRLRNLGQRAKGEHVELGYNERLDGLQAALLRVKLPHLDNWNRARRTHAARYRSLLPSEVRVLHVAPGNECVYHLFPIRVNDRNTVAGVLRTEGIEVGIHYDPAVHEHPAWDGSLSARGQFPVAEAWAAQELSLPMHPELRPSEIERVADAVTGLSLPMAHTGATQC